MVIECVYDGFPNVDGIKKTTSKVHDFLYTPPPPNLGLSIYFMAYNPAENKLVRYNWPKYSAIV